MRKGTPQSPYGDSSPVKGSLLGRRRKPPLRRGGVAAGDGEVCVVCGDVIPEGRQVCPICEARAEDAREGGADDGHSSA